MTREEFDKLSTEKQIEFFNNQMSIGKKAAQINTELGFNEGVTRKRFSRHGYKLNDAKSKYILKDDTSHTNVIESKEIIKSDDRCMTSVSGDNDSTSVINGNDSKNTNVIILENDNDNTLVINSKLKENLIDLAENHFDIKEMLTWFKNRDDNNHTNVIEIVQGITIDLDNKGNARTTIRINNTIWEDFGKFCDDNSHLDKQDLHAMALKEYMDKHKKI